MKDHQILILLVYDGLNCFTNLDVKVEIERKNVFPVVFHVYRETILWFLA